MSDTPRLRNRRQERHADPEERDNLLGSPAADGTPIPAEWDTGRLAQDIRRCDDTNEMISIYFEGRGDPSHPCVLFINGLGSQMIDWDDDLLDALVAKGFYCIRYDNRDVGFSTKIVRPAPKLWKFALPGFCCCCCPEKVHYPLDAMAADANALLEHLGIETAHLVGQSMGGMIAQLFAIHYPSRTRSLSLVFSSSGNRSIKEMSFSTKLQMVRQPRDGTFEELWKHWKGYENALLANGSNYPSEEVRFKRSIRFFQRCQYRAGKPNHALAAVTAKPRDAKLKELDVPSLVFHGKEDLLIPHENGEHLHQLIRGSRLVLVEGMSHMLGPAQRSQLAEELLLLYNRVK